MKIKVFKFPLTDWSGELATAQDIEEEINDWLRDIGTYYKVKGARADTYTVKQHNNGKGDWVEMIYTIWYDD